MALIRQNIYFHRAYSISYGFTIQLVREHGIRPQQKREKKYYVIKESIILKDYNFKMKCCIKNQNILIPHNFQGY